MLQKTDIHKTIRMYRMYKNPHLVYGYEERRQNGDSTCDQHPLPFRPGQVQEALQE